MADQTRPDCYQCANRRNLAGDRHSFCVNIAANVKGNLRATAMGYFLWPFNYDPIWLLECDGFKPIGGDNG